MFEAISSSLTQALGNITGSHLTERNVRDAMGKVQTALLEADVNYDVAKSFCNRVVEQASGEKVLKSLNPSQMIVGIVYQELVNLMGPVDHSISLRRGDVTIIMMCGLQGSGKTTTCGKLAKMLKEQGAKPMLVAADLQRPAAIEQLKVIGEQVGVPVYAEDPGKAARCRSARTDAKLRIEKVATS